MPPLDITQILIAFAVLLFSLTVHEAAHAFTADRLGDPTARLLGRVSLNPAVHVDPIGTVLFPLIAIATNLPVIGWAKPVPVDGRNLRHFRRDFMLIAAAGPASNLVLAAIAAVVWRVLSGGAVDAADVPELVVTVLQRMLLINVLLAVFNMIPIPPLDGGNVLAGLLPPAAGRAVRPLATLGVPAALCADAHGHAERHRRPPGATDPVMAPVAARARVVSGMRPTGRLHLGHLVGALRNWVDLQAEYDCFYFVADWHALTSGFADTSELTAYARDNAADWIAAGLDPERSTLFVQSLVPEHAELALLLSMIIPIPWLERVPTYKEQIDQLSDKDLSSVGFLSYPLLQTADVIMYNARYVPVGEDQVPHLELSREIVRRFHNLYGEVFVEPQPLLTPVPRLPGLDNRKMSKSYQNTIDLADPADVVIKKVRMMYTDPKRIRADIPGTVEGNPVFIYHEAFNPCTAEVEDLKARYREGRVGDVEVKTKLATALNTLLEPMRQRRAEVLARPGYVRRGALRRLQAGACARRGDDGARA